MPDARIAPKIILGDEEEEAAGVEGREGMLRVYMLYALAVIQGKMRTS